MSTQKILEGAIEHLRGNAGVKTVYGEPVTADGKTIIPVAKVAKEDEKAAEGGGGGVAAKPVGVVEISEGKTRFVRFGQARKLAAAALIGLGVGMGLGTLIGRRRKSD